MAISACRSSETTSPQDTEFGAVVEEAARKTTALAALFEAATQVAAAALDTSECAFETVEERYGDTTWISYFAENLVRALSYRLEGREAPVGSGFLFEGPLTQMLANWEESETSFEDFVLVVLDKIREEACDATAQPACPEPAHPLPSGACLVLPEHADPALPVAIYLHGMIAHPGFAHGEWMQLARIAGDRLALLLPLGRKGECAWSPEYEEHLCWPTMPQRKAALDALVAELQADLEEVRRRLGREGAITPFLVGYSNGGVGAFQIAASTEMPLAGLFRMTTESALLRTFVRVVEEVRAIPYRWPGKPDAEAVRREGYGTCASKHALLAERLREADIAS